MVKRKQKSCHQCRSRHLKCDGELPCLHCQRGGRACSRDNDHIILNESNIGIIRRHKKYDLAFDGDQIWMDIPCSVKFADATPITFSSGSESAGSTPALSAKSSVDARASSTSLRSACGAVLPLEKSTTYTDSGRQNDNLPIVDVPASKAEATQISEFWFDVDVPDFQLDVEESQSLNQGDGWQACSLQEAMLMEYYIREISPWFNLVDFTLHFATSIPQMAATSPALLNAIFALASTHLFLLGKLDESISLKYKAACYKALNPNIHEKAYDTDTLAAVLMLRCILHMTEEELMEHLHLRYLGQDIFLAAWKAQPTSSLHASIYFNSLRLFFTVGFDNRHSLYGLSDEDRDWMLTQVSAMGDETRTQNYKVLLLTAQCGNYACSDDKTWQRWSYLKKMSDDWTSKGPPHFRPVYAQDLSEGNPFPKRHFMSGSFAVTHQYYCLGRLLLFNSQPQTSPPLAYRNELLSTEQSERLSLMTLRAMLGTAFSHPDCDGATLKAIPAILYSGHLLRDRVSQEHAYRLLEAVKRRMRGVVRDDIFGSIRRAWGWDQDQFGSHGIL